MNANIANELLTQHLPLQARQAALSKLHRYMHQSILYSLVTQGRPLSRAELAAQLGDDAIDSFLQRLSNDDLLVLDASGQTIVGAYPLTTAETPHAITVNGQHLYAMCALDAVAIAPLFDAEVQITSHCHITKTPIHIHMQGSTIHLTAPSPAVRVGVRWQHPSGHAAHSLCMEMVFLLNEQTANQWQGDDPVNYSVFMLPTAVEFGALFFKPLLMP